MKSENIFEVGIKGIVKMSSPLKNDKFEQSEAAKSLKESRIKSTIGAASNAN